MSHDTASSFRGNYHVIKSVAIKNFRGFGDVSISGLKRINVLTGQNASGKTAFLEALYLALGANPALYFKIKTWRSLGERIELVPSPVDLWRDLFHHLNIEKEIAISYKGTSHHTRELKIFVDKKRPILIPVKDRMPGAPQLPLTFRWKKGAKLVSVRPVFTKEGVVLHGTIDPVSASFFAAGATVSAPEAANRFGNLIKVGEETSVKDAMRELFPIIEDLEVLPYAGEPMVYAKLVGQKEKIPLGLVSLGINRALAYFVGVFEHANNAILIDEIEGGLHYSTMPSFWNVLFKLCAKNKTQLFTSSHSLEALKSLLPAMKKHGDDQFCLLKNTRLKDGSCSIRQVDGDSLKAALEQGMEVR